jgi:chromate transporter
VGYRLQGVLGSAFATLGVVSASFLIVLVVSDFVIKNRELPWLEVIFSSLRPIVVGLIVSAAVSVGKTAIIDIKSMLIWLGGLGLLLNTRIHPILAIVLGGVVGVVLY